MIKKIFKRSITILISCLFLFGCLEEKISVSPVSVDLPSNHPPIPIDGGGGGTGGGTAPAAEKLAVTTVNVLTGGRIFVLETLRNVFLSTGSSSADIANLETIFNNTIKNSPQDFGGSIEFYSTLGLATTSDYSNNGSNGGAVNDDNDLIPQMVPSTPARTALLGEACRQILEQDVYLLNSLAKIGITAPTTVAPTINEVDDLANLFSPGVVLSDDVMNSYLVIIQNLETDATLVKLERWRMLVDLACENPYWQIL